MTKTKNVNDQTFYLSALILITHPIQFLFTDFPEDLNSRSQLYWTPHATRLLIRIRGSREAEFDQPGAKKSQLWNEICNEMRENGYDLSADKVSKKWHNIMITYSKNKAKKHGNINWEFFDDIEDVLHNKGNRDSDSEGESNHYVAPGTLLHLEQNGVDVKPAKRKQQFDPEPVFESKR